MRMVSRAILPLILFTPAALSAQLSVKAPGGFVPQQAIAYGAPDTAATAVDAAHPLPVAPSGVAVTYSDRSGAIAAGGTAQQIAPANAARRGFFIQNVSTADLWINSLGAATAAAPSLKIAPGQLYESPSSGVPATAISIVGASTGQAFSAREW